MMDRIYIITDRKLAGENLFEIIKNLVKEGYRFIQLRENDLSPLEMCQMTEKILNITNNDINLVINDRVDIAKIYNLYGVQLKEISISPHLVKKNFPDLKIGLSCHEEKRLLSNEAVADFFVFGNIFETSCKAGLKGKGIERLKNIISLTKKPLYAIGGINPENARLIKEAGCYGVAVRSLVFGNNNYLKDLEKIRKIWS